MKTLFLFLCPFLFLTACSDKDEPTPETEKAIFSRNPELVRERAHVTNLKVIGNKLYFGNANWPGFIGQDGKMVTFCANSTYYDLAEQQIVDGYILTAQENRQALVLSSHQNCSADIIRYPDYDATVEIMPYRSATFGLNEDQILAFFRIPNKGIRAVMFKIELPSSSNLYKAKVLDIKVLEPDFVETSMSPYSVLKHLDGWLVGTVTNGVRQQFFVTKDGTFEEVKLPGIDFEIILFNYEDSKGDVYFTTERNIIYKAERGDLTKLRFLTQTNHLFKVSVIGEKLIFYNNFKGQLFEGIQDSKGAFTEFKELDNEGLEYTAIQGVELFNDLVYVATSEGLYSKPLKEFWSYKEEE
jgi:hypothetical protein